MANRFWVGSNATWDGTAGTKWATTSGGVGGSAVPTAADDVFFSSLSTGTCTLSASSVARSINCTGFTGTISHPAATTISIGDATAGASSIALKLVAGMTYTIINSTTSAISYVSTSATVQTIDTGGKTMGNSFFDTVGNSYQWISSYTSSTGATLQHTGGTLDWNGQTFNIGSMAGNSALVRTLTLGAANITLNGTINPWNWSSNVTNLTFNCNTSTITVVGNASGTFAGGGQTYNDVAITGSGSWTMSGTNTFHNLTRTSVVSGSQALIVAANIVVSNILTCTGTYTGTNAVRINICSAQFSATTVQRTITVNGSVSLTNTDFHCINAQGTAGTWTGTSMGDGGSNTNITFDVSRNLYWFGTAGNWSTLNRWFTATGGGGTSATAPLPQDNCFVDVNSTVAASNSFNSGLRYLGRNIDFTGVPNAATLSWQLGAFNPAVTGNLTWAAGMTLTNSGAAAGITMWYDTRGVTLTTAGILHDTNWRYTFCGTGSITFADDLTLNTGAGDGITHNQGTFNSNNKNLSIASFTSGQSATRVINMGSGTWTLAGTGTVWSISGTGMTLNAQTSTIVISDTSVTAKTFAGFSLTYNNVSVTGGGSGSVTFSNTSTWNTMTLNAPKTIIFQSASTQTVSNFVATGTAGNVIAISASTGGTKANLSKSSGIVSADYLSLTDSNATGGASWYAGANSTSVSNNSGWIFSAPPSGTPNLLMMGMG
jgi:hypothetical protein